MANSDPLWQSIKQASNIIELIEWVTAVTIKPVDAISVSDIGINLFIIDDFMQHLQVKRNSIDHIYSMQNTQN